MRENVIDTIEKEKIVVIVRGVEKEKLVPLVEAMYNGGIRLLEVTFDSTGKTTDEETAMLSAQKGGFVSPLTEKQVELVKAAGGSFIISPNIDEKVIKKTRELDMVSMPGALTPTEIQKAHSYGADFVKLFPASNFGPEYVKAIKAPLGHIKLTVVGGIDENNMKDYIKSGVSGFGVGTNITNKKMIMENDFNGITELARKYVSVLK